MPQWLYTKPSTGIIQGGQKYPIRYIFYVGRHRVNLRFRTQISYRTMRVRQKRGLLWELVFDSLECLHPQSAGTVKSQHRVGTRKRPLPKKTITNEHETTCVLERNKYNCVLDFFWSRVCLSTGNIVWGGHIYMGKNMGFQFAAWWRNLK